MTAPLTLSEALARLTAAERERDALRATVARLHEEVLRWQHGEECDACDHDNCGLTWETPHVWRCAAPDMNDSTTREECLAAELAACTCGLSMMVKALGGAL